MDDEEQMDLHDIHEIQNGLDHLYLIKAEFHEKRGFFNRKGRKGHAKVSKKTGTLTLRLIKQNFANSALTLRTLRLNNNINLSHKILIK